MTGYRPRPVTRYGVELLNGWPTKLYGLATEGEPGSELLDAARAIASATLPPINASTPPVASAIPPLAPDERAAFVIAHRARPACFVLVYWWSTAVDLSLAYFRSPLDQPAGLTPMPQYSAGCVWELAITHHERTGWINHMLTKEPDLNAYLASWV